MDCETCISEYNQGQEDAAIAVVDLLIAAGYTDAAEFARAVIIGIINTPNQQENPQ